MTRPVVDDPNTGDERLQRTPARAGGRLTDQGLEVLRAADELVSALESQLRAQLAPETASVLFDGLQALTAPAQDQQAPPPR